MSIQLRNLCLFAMPTPSVQRKAVSRGTDSARFTAVAGVFSPWHVFTETSREPRRAPCLFAQRGVVHPVQNRTRSAAAAGGRRQKRRTSAAKVTGRQGKPEAAAIGRRAVLRTHSTYEGGEPQGSGNGRPRYPLKGRGKQVDVSMRAACPRLKPATFDMLGFTHITATSLRGKFTIHLKTMKKRLRRAVKATAVWCREHRHDGLDHQWRILRAKLRGHYQYYGRRTNYRSLLRFYRLVRRIWYK